MLGKIYRPPSSPEVVCKRRKEIVAIFKATSLRCKEAGDESGERYYGNLAQGTEENIHMLRLVTKEPATV